MKFSTLTCVAAGLFWFAQAAAAAGFTSDKDKLSYALGVLYASRISFEAEIDPDAFLNGVSDVLKKANLKLSNEEMQAVVEKYRDQQIKLNSERAAKNDAAGRKFLADNAKKQGVHQLPSGLQYKIIKQGNGAKPTADNTVVVNYRGTFVDGKEFDSSYGLDHPAEFEVSRVIKGFQEALTNMPVGSKWEVYIPPQLAYGENGKGPVEPNSTLIFQVELLGIK